MALAPSGSSPSSTAVPASPADRVSAASLSDDAVTFFNQLRERQRECILDIQTLSRDLASIDERIELERKRLGIREPELDRKTLLDRAVTQFNDKPAKGLAMLHARGELSETAEDIARFLFSQPGLSKTAIGEYLGDNSKLNLQVWRGGRFSQWGKAARNGEMRGMAWNGTETLCVHLLFALQAFSPSRSRVRCVWLLCAFSSRCFSVSLSSCRFSVCAFPS